MVIVLGARVSSLIPGCQCTNDGSRRPENRSRVFHLYLYCVTPPPKKNHTHTKLGWQPHMLTLVKSHHMNQRIPQSGVSI